MGFIMSATVSVKANLGRLLRGHVVIGLVVRAIHLVLLLLGGSIPESAQRCWNVGAGLCGTAGTARYKRQVSSAQTLNLMREMNHR